MAKKASLKGRDLNTAVDTRWKHQVQSLKYFKKRPRGNDFSDPGTGKTAVQVWLYDERPQPKGRWLIICPKTLMTSAWGEDIEKFAPRLTVSFATAENREEAFKAKTDVVVLNTDGVKWLDKNPKYLKGFDHLTIDEVTTYKHANSQRTKAMVRLRKHFKYRYALSGTPNPNSVMELFTPMLIIDDGKRLGTSYYRLRNIVQTPEQIGPSPDHLKWTDKPGATQAVQDMIGDITIRHAFTDVMAHVPPNHQHVKRFDLSKSAMNAYNRMANEAMLTFEDGVVDAVHAASLRTKLLQIASGAVYDQDGNYRIIDPGRYELIADLVDEVEHSVVFFNWKHQREQLAKHFDKRSIHFAVIDGDTPQRLRDEIVRDYQAGTYQTILLHPRTGAHGLTLTRGDTTIFSSPIYEADMMRQGLARIYRGSQDKVTNTIFIEAKNTVEKLVYERLHNKDAAMQDLLQMLKESSKT